MGNESKNNLAMDSLFHPELIRINLCSKNSCEVISRLSELLKNEGYTKDSFKDAVLEREKIYPTGLPTGKIGIAIPHTDSVHVKKSGIAVGVLRNPVKFFQMGDPENHVMVEIVLLLAFDDPKALVPLLQRLCTIFQDELLLEKIKNNKSTSGIANQLRMVVEN